MSVAAVVKGVLDALALVAPVVERPLVDLIETVRGQRPDLVTEPLPDLATVDAAREAAKARIEGGT